MLLREPRTKNGIDHALVFQLLGAPGTTGVDLSTRHDTRNMPVSSLPPLAWQDPQLGKIASYQPH